MSADPTLNALFGPISPFAGGTPTEPEAVIDRPQWPGTIPRRSSTLQQLLRLFEKQNPAKTVNCKAPAIPRKAVSLFISNGLRIAVLSAPN